MHKISKTLHLEKWSHGGEALAFDESARGPSTHPVFVPGGVPGDVVTARIISSKKQYSRALIEELKTPGPARREAPCPVYEHCGGCQWQHTTDAEQLVAKRQLLIETLRKVGGWDMGHLQQVVQPVLGMETPWAYRNKAQFPVQRINGQLKLGFYAPRSHDLTPVEHCLIQHDLMNELLCFITEALQNMPGLTPYDEQSHTGELRHVVLRHGFKTRQTLVGFVVNEQRPKRFEALAQQLLERFDHVKGVVLNLNAERTNRILGPQTLLLAGQDFYTDQLGDLHFDVSLPAFFQVNPLQTERLYNVAREFLTPVTGRYSTLLDAYSGAGTLSLWLAGLAESVIGVESNGAAVSNARANAKKNGVSGVRFIEDRVENVISGCIEQVDAMLVDPPRKGCDARVLQAFVKSDIPQLVYISCNPATLARDSKLLRQAGFALTACQPVDMFPQTHHLETVACFEREVGISSRSLK